MTEEREKREEPEEEQETPWWRSPRQWIAGSITVVFLGLGWWVRSAPGWQEEPLLEYRRTAQWVLMGLAFAGGAFSVTLLEGRTRRKGPGRDAVGREGPPTGGTPVSADGEAPAAGVPAGNCRAEGNG